MKLLFDIGEISVYQSDDDSAFLYISGLEIDADGAPNAYHPEDIGIDYLDNAGDRSVDPPDWWALVVDQDGNPIKQEPDDPYPGYYVSTTSLENPNFEEKDPRKYVDSTTIPYIVLAGNSLIYSTGATLGDFAVVYNGNNRKAAFAIYADVGPQNQLGEGSVALCQALGHDPFVNGRVESGIAGNILYIVFSGSGNGKPRTLNQIQTEGTHLLEKLGGINQVKAYFDSLS